MKVLKTNGVRMVNLIQILLFVVIVGINPCFAEHSAKGALTIAQMIPFGMNGGDCHTSIGGNAASFNYLLHDQLAKATSDGNLEPAIAKSWEFSENGNFLDVVVNEKARFHDGTEVTAEDVKFSIERAMRPELKFNIGGELNRHVESITVKDKYNLVVNFKKPYPGFLIRTAPFLGIIPKAYVEKVGDKEYAQKPIGCGPFKMVNFKQDVFADFVAVEGHYRKTPNVKKVHFIVVTEDVTRMAMLQTGEADIINLPPANIPEVKKDKDLRVIWGKFSYVESLAFYDLANADKKTPWFDARVRRAASMAIDRKAICEIILNGAAEPIGDILAPYQPGFDASIPYPEYNPEKAKDLLKEAGYPKGFKTKLYSNTQRRVQLEAIAANLASIGIIAEVNAIEDGTYSLMTTEKKFQGLGIHPNPYWAGQNHPGIALQSTISSNSYWSYHTIPEAEKILNDLSKLTDRDEDKMARLAAELSKVYRDSEIRSMLWARHSPFGVSKKIKKWEPIAGWFYPGNIENVELAE